MTTKKRNLPEEKFEAYSFRIRAPSGTMFLVVNERDRKIDNIQIYIGKTGSQVYAYVNAIADLINLNLHNGASIEDVITILSNLTSDKVVYNENTPIRSDIDAIVLGFIRYKHQKYREEFTPSRPIFRRIK